MFRKLIKYEWIASFRAMLPVYAAVVLLSIVNVVMSSVQRVDKNSFDESLPFVPYLQATAAFLYSAVMIGMTVFVAVVIVQRFYKGLLKQEGYLMFTLPVKSWELVLSKAVVAILIGLVSMMVAFLSVGILGGMEFLRALIIFPKELFSLIWESFTDDSIAFGKIVLYGVEMIILCLTGVFGYLYRLYASMALGQLSGNHKVLFSVLWFVGLDVLVRMLNVTILTMGVTDFLEKALGMNVMNFLHVSLLGASAYNLIFVAIFWGITNYILERRLNLE